ncbi:MAG TPA: hypothetical protein DHV14_04200 [Micrococcales bacterium]|uniref:hypothetical protein n=1 Tax=Miniimonas arenae TaxID=676201 RepID=UPI000ECE022B|nr:hypothetical protein [Miniimonas arenae]HCX84339.1 hypothetical protein [Micrococcales bacterium]
MSSTKRWVVRLVALTLFNIAVVLAIVLIVPQVTGGLLAMIGAGIVLALATVWIRPALSRYATRKAQAGAPRRSPGTQRLVAALAVFLVAAVIWVLTVLLTDIDVHGWFWGYVVPPLVLLVAWWIYAQVVDSLEAKVASAYDAADRKLT